MEKAGIVQLKDVCVFLALALTCEQKVAADGSVTMGDVSFAMSPLLALPAALSGITEVPSEVMDLDAGEAEELKVAIAANLDLNDDAIEAVVEQILSVALQLAAAALAIKNGQKV
jgi:hypothetical protein